MTNVAEKVAGAAVEKEKVEKRRALGRGLESLLPGPRVVPVRPVGGPQAPGVGPQTSGASAAGQQGSHFVRNDSENARNDHADQLALREIPRPAGENAGLRDDAASVGTGDFANAAAGSAVDLSGWEGPYQDSGDEDANEGPISIQAVAENRMPSNLVINLALTDIDKNPFQTRYIGDDDALQELADSIKANGVVQPIVVRPAKEEGRYVLILGERRMHASKKAGKTHIPAIVRRVNRQQAAEMTIVENLQRDDLSPLEHAESFRILSQEFKLSQAEIGKRVGLSRESVANYMRLLRLPREVMKLLAEKALTFAEAKELLKLNNPDDMQQAALYAVKHGLSLDQIEMLVLRSELEGKFSPNVKHYGDEREGPPVARGARWVDPNVKAAQYDLQRILGVKVKIRDRKGKGKIVIEYGTVDDYERIVAMLKGK